MSIAPATIRAHEEDVLTYGGVDYFELDDRGNAYENHLIVVRNIETGVITIRTWRDDYCNGGYFAGDNATHELLGRSDALRWNPDGGPSLYRCASIIDDVQAQLARQGAALDAAWEHIDISLIEHWAEASVDYCLDIEDEDET